MPNSEEEPIEEEFISDEEIDNPALSQKRLRERLAEAVKEKQQYLENWQRLQADFSNYKREEGEFAKQKALQLKVDLAESLIPTLDSFEMALKSKAITEGDAQLKKGMEAIYSGLAKSLESLGVTSYAPIGETFNPHLHEALTESMTDDPKKEHTVEEVHRRGYSIGDRVIRPAQVSIYTLGTK